MKSEHYLSDISSYLLIPIMDVPIDRFKELANVFGGVIQTYYETYIKDSSDSVINLQTDSKLSDDTDRPIHIPADCDMLSKLVDCLLNRKPLDEKTLRYASSDVLDIGDQFGKVDFDRACSKGHIEYARWLGYKPDRDTIISIMKTDNTIALEWCISVQPVIEIVTCEMSRCDKTPAEHMDRKLHPWFVDAETIDYKKEAYRVDALQCAIFLGIEGKRAFEDACEFAAIKIAKYIHANETLDLSDEEVCGMFKVSCEKGNLEIAKMIHQLYPDLDIRDDDNEAAYSAAANGHLHIIKYLMDTDDGLDICDRAITAACENGHLKILKYIAKTTELEADYNSHDAVVFRSACENGHLNIISYMIANSSEKVNIYAGGEDAIIGACNYGREDVVKYLLTIGRWSEYAIKFIVDTFGEKILENTGYYSDEDSDDDE